MNIICPTCTQQLQVPNDATGKKVSCPKCGQRILVPTPPRPTPAPVNKTVLGKIEESVSAGKAPVSPVTAKAPIPVATTASPAKASHAPPQTSPAPTIHVHAKPSRAAHSLGIASLVLGCLTLTLSLIPCVGMIALPLAALGLLLGIVGVVISVVRKGSGIGFPVAGSATNGVALVIASLWMLLAAGLSSSLDQGNQTKQIAENRTNEPKQVTEPLKKEEDKQPKKDDDGANKATEPKKDDDGANKATKKDKDNETTNPPDPPVKKKPVDDGQKKKATPPDSKDDWPDASKAAVRFGDIRVKVVSVKVGIVDLVDATDKSRGRSKDELLQVYLNVENASETKLVHFRGWGSREFGKQPALEDDFKNVYRTNGFGIFSHPVGQLWNEKALYPGKSVDDVVIFDPPVKGVKFLRLRLPAENIGGKGDVRIQVPASMFDPESVKRPHHLEPTIKKLEADSSAEKQFAARLIREIIKGRDTKELLKSVLVESVLERYATDIQQADKSDRGKFILIVGMVCATGADDDIPFIDICDGSKRTIGMRAEFRPSVKQKVAKLKPGVWQLLPDFRGQQRPALKDGDVVCIAGEYAGFIRVQSYTNCILVKNCFLYSPEFQKSVDRILGEFLDEGKKK